MQQTRLDQWLKEKLLYETHIFTMRLPLEGFKTSGVKVSNIENEKKGTYKYKLIVKSSKKAERVIAQLKEEHLMHAARVVVANRWYRKIISPAGQSFTYLWIMRLITACALAGFAFAVYTLLQNADLMDTLKETQKELKD